VSVEHRTAQIVTNVYLSQNQSCIAFIMSPQSRPGLMLHVHRLDLIYCINVVPEYVSLNLPME